MRNDFPGNLAGPVVGAASADTSDPFGIYAARPFGVSPKAMDGYLESLGGGTADLSMGDPERQFVSTTMQSIASTRDPTIIRQVVVQAIDDAGWQHFEVMPLFFDRDQRFISGVACSMIRYNANPLLPQPEGSAPHLIETKYESVFMKLERKGIGFEIMDDTARSARGQLEFYGKLRAIINDAALTARLSAFQGLIRAHRPKFTVAEKFHTGGNAARFHDNRNKIFGMMNKSNLPKERLLALAKEANVAAQAEKSYTHAFMSPKQFSAMMFDRSTYTYSIHGPGNRRLLEGGKNAVKAAFGDITLVEERPYNLDATNMRRGEMLDMLEQRVNVGLYWLSLVENVKEYPQGMAALDIYSHNFDLGDGQTKKQRIQDLVQNAICWDYETGRLHKAYDYLATGQNAQNEATRLNIPTQPHSRQHNRLFDPWLVNGVNGTEVVQMVGNQDPAYLDMDTVRLIGSMVAEQAMLEMTSSDMADIEFIQRVSEMNRNPASFKYAEAFIQAAVAGELNEFGTRDIPKLTDDIENTVDEGFPSIKTGIFPGYCSMQHFRTIEKFANSSVRVEWERWIAGPTREYGAAAKQFDDEISEIVRRFQSLKKLALVLKRLMSVKDIYAANVLFRADSLPWWNRGESDEDNILDAMIQNLVLGIHYPVGVLVVNNPEEEENEIYVDMEAVRRRREEEAKNNELTTDESLSSEEENAEEDQDKQKKEGVTLTGAGFPSNLRRNEDLEKRANENAPDISEKLRIRGMITGVSAWNAWYFLHQSNYFKSQFGNVDTVEKAEKITESFRNNGLDDVRWVVIIDEFKTNAEKTGPLKQNYQYQVIGLGTLLAFLDIACKNNQDVLGQASGLVNLAIRQAADEARNEGLRRVTGTGGPKNPKKRAANYEPDIYKTIKNSYLSLSQSFFKRYVPARVKAKLVLTPTDPQAPGQRWLFEMYDGHYNATVSEDDVEPFTKFARSEFSLNSTVFGRHAASVFSAKPSSSNPPNKRRRVENAPKLSGAGYARERGNLIDPMRMRDPRMMDVNEPAPHPFPYGDVSNPIVATANGHFVNRWEHILMYSSNFINRICEQLVLTQRVHRSAFLNMLDHKIPAPMGIIAVNPYIELSMSHVLFAVAGCGKTYYAFPQLSAQYDAMHKKTTVNLTMWVQGFVDKPENVFLAENVAFNNYIRGGGHTLVGTIKPLTAVEDGFRRDRSSVTYDFDPSRVEARMADRFALHIGASKRNSDIPDPLPLSGYFGEGSYCGDGSFIVGQENYKGGPLFDCALLVNYLLKLGHVNRPGYMSSMADDKEIPYARRKEDISRAWNTTCYRGNQYLADPKNGAINICIQTGTGLLGDVPPNAVPVLSGIGSFSELRMETS